MREAPSGRIYVIEKLRHLDSLLVGTRSWWCVEPTATPGQLCALYLKKQGIALLFRFLAFARALSHSADFTEWKPGHRDPRAALRSRFQPKPCGNIRR